MSKTNEKKEPEQVDVFVGIEVSEEEGREIEERIVKAHEGYNAFDDDGDFGCSKCGAISHTDEEHDNKEEKPEATEADDI